MTNNEDFPTSTGCLIDNRLPEDKIKDWKHEEVMDAAIIVEWKEKPKKDWRFFSRRNQKNSLSCMAQSGSKVLGVENYVETGEYVEPSAMPVYRARVNFPSGGMNHWDLFGLLSKPTACLESQLPSQDMSESEMNSKQYTFDADMSAAAKKYHANGYIFFDVVVTNGKVTKPIDMDKVAAILDQGKAVSATLFFLGSEYWKEVPEVSDHTLLYHEDRASRHGIAIVDYFLYNGKKAFLIEDSSSNKTSIDKKGQRILTEDFFKERVKSAGYLIERKNEEGATTKPKYTFTKTLRYGMVDNEVVKLQEVLVYEGHMPKEINGKPFVPTKNFLGMTLTGAMKLQKKYGLVPDGIVGPLTRAVLNKYYS